MLSTMNHGGRVAMLGLPHDDYVIDWGRVITHMLTIKGIYGREMFDTWYAMSSMLQTSAPLRTALRSVITHRFPAQEWAAAFAAIGSGHCGKVILDWS
jgi:threonine 3-dehydrogenase